jgi:hypothetical protein
MFGLGGFTSQASPSVVAVHPLSPFTTTVLLAAHLKKVLDVGKIIECQLEFLHCFGD